MELALRLIFGNYFLLSYGGVWCQSTWMDPGASRGLAGLLASCMMSLSLTKSRPRDWYQV